MELHSLNSLVQSLKGIDKTKNYLAVSEGRFYQVESQSNKNLNTSKIAALGKEALETLERTKMTYSAKALHYEGFSESLSHYLDRVYRHKNIWQKIVWWIGCASKGEKELWAACKRSNKIAGQLRLQDKTAKDLIKRSNDLFTKECLNKPKKQLKLLYMGLFDSSTLKIDKLEGIDPRVASTWLLDHLEAYRKEMNANHPQAKLVDKVILEFKLHNDLLFAAYESSATCALRRSAGLNMEHWTFQEILGELLSLKTPGDEVTLGGGYRSYKESEKFGHSVQYVVKLEEDESYSLTFVNTGEGGLEESEPLNKKENSLPGALDRDPIKDNVWTGIPKEALTEEFVAILMKRRLHLIPSCMADIKREIVNYLRRFPSVKLGKGREHKLQMKGSCTVKSLTSWLHERLDDPLWRDFKAFYTKLEIQKLDRLAEQIPDPKKRAVFVKEGRRILQKRHAKKVKHLTAFLQNPAIMIRMR